MNTTKIHILLVSLFSISCFVSNAAISIHLYTSKCIDNEWNWNTSGQITSYILQEYYVDDYASVSTGAYGTIDSLDNTVTPPVHTITYIAGNVSEQNKEIWLAGDTILFEDETVKAIDTEADASYDPTTNPYRFKYEASYWYLSANTGAITNTTTITDNSSPYTVPAGDNTKFVTYTSPNHSEYNYWGARQVGPSSMLIYSNYANVYIPSIDRKQINGGATNWPDKYALSLPLIGILALGTHRLVGRRDK